MQIKCFDWSLNQSMCGINEELVLSFVDADKNSVDKIPSLDLKQKYPEKSNGLKNRKL